METCERTALGIVVCGFPGVGKSFYTEHSKVDACDSDSSSFSWASEGVRHPNFPNNYMAHIKSMRDKHDVVFASTHENVRKALSEHEIPYYLVYPSPRLKNQYMHSYILRGSPEGFIKLMNEQWDSFISSCAQDDGSVRNFTLQSREHLCNIMHYIIWSAKNVHADEFGIAR